jgi:hypothetical protein
MLIRTSVRTCIKVLRNRSVAWRSLGTASHGGDDPPPNLALGATAAVLGLATGGMLVSRASVKKETIPSANREKGVEPSKEAEDDDAPQPSPPIDTDAPPQQYGPQNDFGATPLAPDDPYANLPEEDEETHCSLCRTFRQGPCRTYWRRTEACWKEKDSETCLPYSQPFFHCTQYYQNLYHLIILSNYQDDYKGLEEFAISNAWDDVALTTPPTIDFQKWREFQNDFGPSFSQTIPSNRSTSTTKLWQRVRPETDPILVPCDVRIPKALPNGATLVQAFATDQDGFVLGVKEMRQNEKEGDAATEVAASNTEPTSEPVTEEKESGITENEKEDDTAADVEFLCTLLPGATESVVLSAVYWNKEDETDAPVVVRKVFSLDSV